MEVFNEYMVGMMTIFFYAFSDAMPNPAHQYTLGYFMSFALFGMIYGNARLVLYPMWRGVVCLYIVKMRDVRKNPYYQKVYLYALSQYNRIKVLLP